MSDDVEAIESVDSFRAGAREYIRDNFKPIEIGTALGMPRADRPDEEELADIQHERDLQRLLYDGGLAGVCVPVEYGGRGLTPAHQRALNEEITGFEYPARIQAPTMSPCMTVLLDFGTEEQKRTHIPPILKGEELWMQFLSEPSGGSDVAGALTTAVRDGEEWVLNGSKVWTTGAWWSDWGLCLARTNWDVEKHRGLSVFIFPIHQPGIEVQRIALINGFRDFCQEFLTDLRVPDSDRVGEVDDGWTVGSRWMFHERMLHNSPFVTMPEGESRSGTVVESALRLAREVGHLDDPQVRDLVGEAHMLNRVSIALLDRLGEGIRVGALPDQSSSIGRLLTGTFGARSTQIAFELAEADAAAWSDDDDDGPIEGLGVDQLMRQISCIGGGTTEMARNVIAERVLGMPRERRMDKGVAFRDVPVAVPDVGIVVGNPKPASRTLAVARSVASAAAEAAGIDRSDPVEVDLAELGPRLFDWSAADVRDAVDRIAATRLVVVASPTYKATYTGLLKSFLDWYPTTGLSGVTVVPVMVGAGPAHALAVEVHLRPVLVEIGATLPTRGLYVTEDRLDDLDAVVGEWLVEAGPQLRASLRSEG